MRQLRTRASRLRLFLLVAVVSVITLAASSPIYSAASGGHLISHASAAPLAAVATADCSEATARQVVQRPGLEVNIFNLPNPVQQVLCGPFTGPGSNAMAVTIGAPTCWGIQNWAVFRFTAGDWQLVLNQPAYLVPPLVAVGSDIQETTAVHRSGDPRCFFNGGTHARIWHWDGSRLVAGPWKQVTKGKPITRSFYTPSKNITCSLGDSSDYLGVNCVSFKAPQTVKMDANGRLKICHGRRCLAPCGCAPDGIPTLGYGKQSTSGRFRCLSQRSGVTCTVIRFGKGFLINRSGVRRVGR
jgi:hypothetical protein